MAVFNASQELAVENHWNGSTNTGLEGSRTDQPSLTNIGPAWFEAFLTSPEGTRFIYDLNYRDNSSAGVASTVDVAKRVWDTLGPDLLYAFEISNEMERWGGRYRSDEWGPELYTEEFLMYTDLIEEAIWGESEDGSQSQPIFQMGTFMGSGNKTINTPWNSEIVLDLGINKKQQIRSTSQHDVSRHVSPDCSDCGFWTPLAALTLEDADRSGAFAVPRFELRLDQGDFYPSAEPPQPHQHGQPRLPSPADGTLR